MFKLRSCVMLALVAMALMVVSVSDTSACGGCGTPCGVTCCEPCCAPAPEPCCQPCCPPPPVRMELCVKDPCSCCTYQASVCIPACCAGEEACVTWRRGWFGRRVATYTWKCCGHCVDIVVTRHGRVIVRG